MRISDWSSDVCSSDLKEGAANVIVRSPKNEVECALGQAEDFEILLLRLHVSEKHLGRALPEDGLRVRRFFDRVGSLEGTYEDLAEFSTFLQARRELRREEVIAEKRRSFVNEIEGGVSLVDGDVHRPVHEV